MQDTLFQTIFDKLQEGLPERWEKTIFYAGYTEGSYSMKFYVDEGDGIYKDCYRLQTMKDSEMIKLFMQINEEIRVVREQLSDKERWNVLTMCVGSNGVFKVEFDYADIGENRIVYEDEWKKHYLV